MALIAIVTRQGKKIHAASPGSSCCNCGHWLKAQAIYFRVRGTFNRSSLCERCFNFRPEAEKEVFEEMGIAIREGVTR